MAKKELQEDEGKLPSISRGEAKAKAKAGLSARRRERRFSSEVLGEVGLNKPVPWDQQSDATLEALVTGRAVIVNRKP